MDAVTYPDPKVARTIDEFFVPVKLVITKDEKHIKDATEEFALIWTPTIVMLDDQRREIRRTVGWLPPEKFVPELLLGFGQYKILREEFSIAAEVFRRVADESQSEHAAEAQYWLAIAEFKEKGDADPLIAGWHQLRDQQGNSDWWTRASFIDKQ
jgi:thioredoxin-related protein